MRIHISLLSMTSLLAATALSQWTGNRSTGTAASAGDRDGIVRGQVSSDNPFIGSLMVELVAAKDVARLEARGSIQCRVARQRSEAGAGAGEIGQAAHRPLLDADRGLQPVCA